MLRVEELQGETAELTASALLRHLLIDVFPRQCIVTSSLRARSVAVLMMTAEIDRAVPVIFCHAPYVYPQSVQYRAQIVRRLGLTDIRDPGPDEADMAPNDQDHYEELLSDIWGGGTIETKVHLNRSLAGFECWISAAYHAPYPKAPTPRLIQEGRMLRVDPLSGWSREETHEYLARHDLPLHPRVDPPTYHY
ncbi:MAG: phosphoadenosine phosphosulfate reductase family protein [Kiloniellales bacterium]